MTYLVTPTQRRVTFLATFQTPVSHHDPNTASRANVTAFLRQKRVVPRNATAAPSPTQVADIVAAFPVPSVLADAFYGLSVAEFLATATAKVFLESFNGRGQLDGANRYDRFESLMRHHAQQALTMFAWFGGMTNGLEVGNVNQSRLSGIMPLFVVPSALSNLVFQSMIKSASSVIALARMWVDAEYAIRNGGAEEAYHTMTYPAADFGGADEMVLDVPNFSANAVRSSLVRKPSALHLLNALDLRYDELPDGVAAMLYNGGDLNRSAPDSAFALTRQIRDAYPHLSLIGGSTAGFILGASNLDVSAWLNATEYASTLTEFGIVPEMSAFALLDENTHTRHTNKRVEGSPMPITFETLVAGTGLVIDLRFRPYATPLEMGALAAALETYFGSDSTLGGQAARGYGLISSNDVWDHLGALSNERAAYEQYLTDNRDSLRDGLLSGTLTTGKGLF